MIKYIPDEKYENRFDENGSSEKYWNEEIVKKHGMIKNAFKGGVLCLAIGLLRNVTVTIISLAAMSAAHNTAVIKILAVLSPAIILTEGFLAYKQAKQKFINAEKHKKDVSIMKAHKECDEMFTL